MGKIEVSVPEAEWMSISPLVLVPRAFSAKIDDEKYPVIVELKAGVEGGQLRCKRLTFIPRPDGPPLSTASLRSIPLTRLLRQAAQRVAGIKEPSDNEGVTRLRLLQSAADVAQYQKDESAQRRPGRPKLTREHYQDVAGVYREALAQGRHPTKAVQNQFATSHSTASRWVREARKRGILGKTSPGRAGETT